MLTVWKPSDTEVMYINIIQVSKINVCSVRNIIFANYVIIIKVSYI